MIRERLSIDDTLEATESPVKIGSIERRTRNRSKWFFLENMPSRSAHAEVLMITLGRYEENLNIDVAFAAVNLSKVAPEPAEGVGNAVSMATRLGEKWSPWLQFW